MQFTKSQSELIKIFKKAAEFEKYFQKENCDDRRHRNDSRRSYETHPHTQNKKLETMGKLKIKNATIHRKSERALPNMR